VASHVSATYRGYRRQALYVLWRILTDPDASRRSYRPEGEEDLAVFDEFGRLSEAVQVKDLSSPLAVSDLKPSSPDGFIARATRRLDDHPGCRHRLATYGVLGPELAAAIDADPSAREAIKRRLTTKTSERPVGNLDAVFDALRGNVVTVYENAMRADITQRLAGSIAGLHDQSTLDLLLYWIFESSERQRDITRTVLLQQVERIGEYLAGLRDHSTEWMNTVRPLERHDIPEADVQRLRDTYRRGAQATWEHIVAGSDSTRTERLSEVRSKLDRYDAVVIRGASGQGKSSLAFRYLYEFHPDGTRFLVRFVEGRSHAARIAAALRAHVLGMQIPAVALLDLSPADSGWTVLLPELTAAGIKVIVAVREEDIRRAGRFPPAVRVGEVSLDGVTKDEAVQIYESLAQQRATSTLDFDQAWTQFHAREAAPLLEFTHLVTQGQSLALTVEEQIRRLQAEATGGGTSGISERHLRLLALAAIVNSAEARIDLQGALETVGLDPLTRPLAVLEREYLLKADAATRPTLAALHALRSQAVVAALFHDSPEEWISVALRALPLVPDADVERFLLFAFSRYPEHSASLIDALQLLPLRSWMHAGAVGRALVWEGIRRYEQENRQTIDAAWAQYQQGWWMLCDVHVGSDSGPTNDLRQLLADMFKREIPSVMLSDKHRVLSPLRTWASTAVPPNDPPATRQELIDLSDMAFWLRRANAEGLIVESVRRSSTPPVLPEDMSSGELAQVVSGLYVPDDVAFAQWHRDHYEALTQRFAEDTNSISIIDDGSDAIVLFPALLRSATDGTDDTDLHEHAIRRVTQLRHLLPMRAHIGSRGVGIEALASLLPNDPTQKLIPIERLPLSRSVEANSTFLNLVSYRLERADSWQAYVRTVLQFRAQTATMLRGLHRAWGRLVERPRVESSDVRPFTTIGLSDVIGAKVPMFPRSAVDEWGFVSEARENAPSTRVESVMLWNQLQRFAEWRKEWQEYVSCVQRVANTVFDATVKHIAAKNTTYERDEALKAERLVLFNIQGAWQALPTMQSGFRRWFSRYAEASALAELERNERSVYGHLWPTTLAFINNPATVVKGGADRVAAEIKDTRRRFIRAIGTEVRAAMDEDGSARVVEGPVILGGKQCLGVICDHHSALTVETAKRRVVLALRQAARFREWAPFESVDISMQWRRVFVCHSVQGRAVQPAGAFIFTSVLTDATDFEVAGHHTADLPVPAEELAEHLSLRMWDLPLVSAAVALHGHLASFMFAMMQGATIMAEMHRHELSGSPVAASLRTTSQAITEGRRRALMSYQDVAALLESHKREGSEEGPFLHLQNELQPIVERLTFGDLAGVRTLGMEDFEKWMELAASDGAALNVAIAGLVDLALAAYSNAETDSEGV
jgi:hypothetical protein